MRALGWVGPSLSYASPSSLPRLTGIRGVELLVVNNNAGRTLADNGAEGDHKGRPYESSLGRGNEPKEKTNWSG